MKQNNPTKQALIVELIAQIRQEVQLGLQWSEAVAKANGLHMTDVVLLGFLQQNESATVGELAAFAGRTTGATSMAIHRLERAGFVKREADVKDGRKTIVHPLNLPPKLQAIYTSVRGELTALLSSYTKEQLQLLSLSRKDVATMLKKQIAVVTRNDTI